MDEQESRLDSPDNSNSDPMDPMGFEKKIGPLIRIISGAFFCTF
ncbi:MAG: hypothetical protein Ct9H300mP6_15940 [Gammaproteobacteria bacterium]|nr:MAG: hypothetical protein Ct9H300mP6_15940 [Gammaproteobacteria bacterium]